MKAEIKVSRVRLDRGGYDKSGRYFGRIHGYSLYRADIDDGVNFRTEYIQSEAYQSARAYFKFMGKVLP